MDKPIIMRVRENKKGEERKPTLIITIPHNSGIKAGDFVQIVKLDVKREGDE